MEAERRRSYTSSISKPRVTFADEAFYLAAVSRRVGSAPLQLGAGASTHFSLFDGGQALLGGSGDL